MHEARADGRGCALFATQSPGDEAWALKAAGLALKLNVSVRHVWRMVAAGKLPEPRRIGRCVRWRAAEIDAWFSAGCPRLSVWQKMQGVMR
jgi:excisionase family DNA binding protein